MKYLPLLAFFIYSISLALLSPSSLIEKTASPFISPIVRARDFSFKSDLADVRSITTFSLPSVFTLVIQLWRVTSHVEFEPMVRFISPPVRIWLLNAGLKNVVP